MLIVIEGEIVILFGLVLKKVPHHPKELGTIILCLHMAISCISRKLSSPLFQSTNLMVSLRMSRPNNLALSLHHSTLPRLVKNTNSGLSTCFRMYSTLEITILITPCKPAKCITSTSMNSYRIDGFEVFNHL